MNPMRSPGANITSAAPLHKTFATVNGQLVHDASPVNIQPRHIVANNRTLPSQEAARARVREAFGAFRDSQSK